MAIDTSFIDSYLPKFPVAKYPEDEVAAAPQPSAYDRLTPTQKAWVDKQIELQKRPRSALGEIGAGVMRGAVSELPKLIGQGMKATGKPGDTLYDLGTSVVEGAAAREPKYAEDVNPDAHNAVTQAFAQGGAMLAPSLAPLVAVPLLAAAGVPAAAGLGIAGAAGAGLFGASQYQNTYEKAIKAGKTPEQAHELGLQTGTVEGVGEGAATMLGGKFLGVAGRMVLPRMFGKMAATDAAALLAKPKFLPTLAKEYFATAAGETATEVGQNFGEAYIEKKAGIDNTDPYAAATSAIGPTLAMTTLLAPVGGAHLKMQQSRTASLMAKAQDPNSTPEQVAAATKELAPYMLPLAGKEATTEWRMKVLEDSNKNAETRKAAADALAQQQQEGQGQEILDANIAAAQKAKDYELLRAAATPTEGGPLTFAQYMKQEMQQLSLDFAGGKKKKKGADATESTLRGNYLQYLRDFDAQKQQEAAANAPAERNPAQGEMFATWAPAQPRGQRGESIPVAQEAPFQLEPGAARNPLADAQTQAELQNESLPFTPRNDAQGELDLMPVMNQPGGMRTLPDQSPDLVTQALQQSPRPAERMSEGEVANAVAAINNPAPKTAMQIAFERAGGKKALETDAAYAQRQRELLQQAQAEAKLKKNDETALAIVAEQTRRVEAANKLADDALAGKINGNTPVAHEDLMHTWEQAATEQGMDTSVLRGQSRAKVVQAIKSASGKKLWMQQLKALRAARDAMTEGTVSRDTMDALVRKLENWNGRTDEVSPQEAGQGTAQPVQQGQDASQGQDAGQGLLTPEVTNAPAAPVPAPARAAAAPKKSKAAKAAVTPVAAEANAEAAAPTSISQGVTPNAAPVSEEVPTPPPVAPEGAGAAPTVVVSHTGESRPVGYGESSTSVPAGDIKYGKAALYPRRKTQTVGEQAATRADEERFTPAPYHAEVPSSERRNVPEEKLFGFEILNYNPNAGRGTADVNVHWINEYNRALKLADQKTSAGEPTPAALNARAALKWLDEYEGADIAERIILRRIEGIFDVNDRFKEMAAERAKEIADAVNYEMEQIALERKERIARGMGLEGADTWTRAQLSAINAKLAKEERKQQAQNAWRKRELKAQDKAKAKNALAELQRQYLDIATQVIQGVADNDPTIMNLHAAIPNYTPTSELFALAKKGDGNAVLDHLATAGPSDWIRSVASLLRGLNLGTKIRFINKVARDADGKRVYARYDHGQNLVNVYIGGDNPHTMTHEIAHAASVGMVRMAKAALAKPEAQRTSQEQQLVQALGELRALMADLKKLNPPGSYAFTNEEEFLAEALSNDKLQQWMGKTMMSEARTWWQRIVDWFTSLFGGNRALDMTAFAKVLSLVPTFVTGSRFAAEQGLSFNHSAAAAMGQTDSALSSLISRWEHWTANVSLGTLGVKARMAAWMASSTFGIAQMVQRIPALKSMVHGVNDVRDADAKRGVVRQMKAQEFSTITDALKFALAKLPYTAARAMNEKLMWFAGNMSALGIDLNKNFEENKRTNPDLDPANRAFINQLHSEYKQLGESFRKPLEASFRVFRKNYIQHTAMVLRDIMRTYKGTSPQLEAMEGLLDILNPALSEGTNPRPDYYHDAYSANLDKVIRRVMSEARGLSTGKDHLSADIRDVEKFYLAAVSNPYMHLGRSGDHFLEFNAANVPGGWESIRAALAPFGKGVGARNEKGHVFLRFEDPGKRDAAQRAITALGAVVQGGSLRSGSLFDSDSLTNSQGVLRLARNLIQKVETDYPGPKNAEMRAAIRELILRMAYDMLPDSSPQQALRERKNGGIAGYDLDFMRNFAKRSEGMASMMANSYSMPMYDKAFALLKDETGKLESAGNGHEADMAKEVLSEMSKRFVNSITPVDSPLIDSFKAYGFNYFLAFSPAFWLTNLAQPWHLTLPVLGGKFGFVKAAKEMGRSTAKAAKLMQAAVKAGWNSGNDAGGKYGALLGVLDLKLPVDQVGLTDEEQEYVKRLILSGELDTTQGHELARYASGDSPTTTAITKTLSMGSHYTEVLNRLTAGLAGYNLARAAEKPMSIEAATLYATNEVVHTQFNYSDHNIARALGRHGVLGKVTPLVSSFSHYSFQTIEFLIHLTLDSIAPIPTGGTQEEIAAATEARAAARRSLMGVLGTTGVLAGSLGMPAMSVLTAVIDRVLGSDDDPLDSKAAYRKWLADTFGTEVGEAIARGVPRALMGFDTSSRMGMQDIIPGSRFMSDRRAFKDKMEAGAFNLLGPAVSAATSTAVGAGKIMDGQVMDGLIDFLPLALKGPAKAVKQQDEGFTTTTGNKLPLEVTPWGTAAQAIGFTPSARAEQSEVNFAFRQRDALLKQRKNTLANAAYKAIEQGEDATDALQEVMRFNEQNPQYRIDIGSGLRLRAKQRATAEVADIPTLPRYLPMLDRYSYANVK